MLRLCTLLLAGLVASRSAFARPKSGSEPITFVVMDPLAKELACACVKGFGQRDYRKLAARLEKAARQRLNIEFSDDLAESLKANSSFNAGSSEVIVVGDESVMLDSARQAHLKIHPVCQLTGVNGETTLSALFIVRSDDPAKELKDVSGRKLLFGLPEGDAKHRAGIAALREAGTEAAMTVERGSYSDAALDVLDNQSSPGLVAVIPSYAMRLLEGCGNVKPGSLRVIGKTRAVPFITLFVSDNVPAGKEEKIVSTLVSIKGDPGFLKAMESRDGFVPCTGNESRRESANADWPDWRGRARDGHVSRLPSRLSATPSLVWKKAAMNDCLAGLSVSNERLILAERDFGDESDLYRCLNARNGELLWVAQFPARGKLDFGQSPRATPVIHAGKAYLLGAFGDLRCVDVTNGKVIWQRQLPREFKTPLPTWGTCSTPLIVDNLLIVNPGATNASLAALDCDTGHTRWTTPGSPAAYSSFICGKFGGLRQIVGYDRYSLGGWDVQTGKRLWQLVPPTDGDFNVPTPVPVDGGIIAATENNGVRLYRFDDAGRIVQKPAAQFAELSPTTTTPVVTCGRVFGACPGLHCLDVEKGLRPVWHHEEDALGDHATLIADGERVLIITLNGELILLDGKADRCAIISRMRLFDDDVELYSHPALVGQRLYARGGSTVMCVDLGVN